MAKSKRTETSGEGNAGETDNAGKEVAAAAIDPQSTADRVDALHRQRERDRAEHKATAWQYYRRMLLVGDSSDASAEDLVSVCEELEITPDQMRRDVATIAKARELGELVEQYGEFNRKRVEARAARVATEDRHKIELKKAKDEEWHWVGLTSRASEARDRLVHLSRGRPELFDTSVTPPRLREG